jgi:ATP-binding cassette subfamily A (ABC1) protein 3
VSAELTFLLPFTSSQHFPTLLDTLEQQQERLGYTSFGVSRTTMEDVFMKVGTGSAEMNENLMLPQNSTATPGASFGESLAPSDPLVNEKLVRNTSPMSLADEDVVCETQHRGYHELGGSYSIIRHTGPVLWFQQFVAMFLKRFYNSLRYYLAILTQLFLPLIFVLLGLTLIKIQVPISHLEHVPRRELTLRKSAMSRNVTAFWAQFGDVLQQFDFANVAPELITATNFFDYTARARNIKDKVKNYSTITDCCGYKYQLLDKFCASQYPVRH